MTATQERLGAVKSEIQPMKLSDQEIVDTVHTAIGAMLVLVARSGQTLTNDSAKNKTAYLWRAWTMGSSLMDRNQRRGITVSTPREPLRFW